MAEGTGVYAKGIVIIGGGHGGSQAAASLREAGYEERLTLLTDEREIPYQRPPLSKAFLKEPDYDLLPLRAESFYQKNEIELRLGCRAAAIDTGDGAVTLDDGSSVPADRIILATGSRARIPAVPGTDLDGLFTVRNVGDARELRDRISDAADVVVVGGGFIGLEVAATARQLGKTVTVLEAADRLMGRAVAPEISAHFLSLHTGWGADVRLGTPVGAFVGEGGRLVAVDAADGDRIPADIAIVGIGAIANTELAEAAGIVCDNGIVVNDFVETSVASVLAIGDVATFEHWLYGRRLRLESVQNATDQARTAARVLTGNRAPYRDVPWFWSDQGDAKLQMVGLPFGASQSVVRGDRASGSFSVFHYDDDTLLAIDSVNRAGDHVVGRHLLGSGYPLPPSMAVDEDVNLKKYLKEQRTAQR
ncbi:MAG: NAD(P)/FAD-dependent oxidoreductase [Alphaproteobacteria bacterium]